MRAFYYVAYPLNWAKGGHAVQVTQTVNAIRQRGIETVWLDPHAPVNVDGDILHYFSRPPNDFHWQLAKQRGMKIVVSELFPHGARRPRWAWYARRFTRYALPHLLGNGIHQSLGVAVYRNLDAAIAVTPTEADYMRLAMGSPAGRTHFVPNGVDDAMFDKSITPEPFDGLLYVAYICRRKNSIEVARQAKRARVPVKFVGGPVVTEDDYARGFALEVDRQYVFWEPEVTDRKRLAAIYRGARGSFLASRAEAAPLTLLESLAVGKPVMAPDQPNLRAYFGDAVRYAPPPNRPQFAPTLRVFYDDCKQGLTQTFAASTWHDVAGKIVVIYESITNTDTHTLP